MTLQQLTDEQSEAAERAYETWRGWQQQWALRQIEQRLRGEGVEGQQLRLSPFARGVGWALLATLAVGVVIYLILRALQ